MDIGVGSGLGEVEALAGDVGEVGLVGSFEAFGVAGEGPDVVEVLAGSADVGVVAEVGLVDGEGFVDAVLLEQQGSEGVADGLHPAPGLVVVEVVVEFDGVAQVGEGGVEVALSVGDFAAHHLLGDGEDVAAGVV